ncbi:leucine-rich repeat-containing protein 23 isoform X2 [Anoplolepis gracilipes]|uniref:leucine-rich repeat-containing protein 23 isoform X2 n=1 Tax=Anoplolepis gracilipes TaxID=354296 RepID=UPI003BA15A7E
MCIYTLFSQSVISFFNSCKQMEEEEEKHEQGEREIYESLVLTYKEVSQNLQTLESFGSNIAYRRLNVSDKNLTDVRVIPHFQNLLYVNVSGNRLTSEAFRVLETMPYLRELLADRNLLTSAELKPMRCLQILTLNQNKLTYAGTSVIPHVSLEYLELKNNLISTIVFEDNPDNEILRNLKILELRGNALTTTAGIRCSNLRQLFLAQNQIEQIESLGYLPNLTTLHLRSNRLANLDGFSAKCHNLSYINLRDNNIPNISELAKLSCLPNLKKLIILENPFLQKIRETEETKYIHIVLMMLPELDKIDKIFVEDPEREQAKILHKNIKARGYDFTVFDLEGFVLKD